VETVSLNAGSREEDEDDLPSEALLDAMAFDVFAIEEDDDAAATRVDVEASAQVGDVGREGLAVGIDLGTTNSAVAAFLDGEAVVLTDDPADGPHRGMRTIPSAVAYGPHGEVSARELCSHIISQATNRRSIIVGSCGSPAFE
jgi:hypothetical protein